MCARALTNDERTHVTHAHRKEKEKSRGGAYMVAMVEGSAKYKLKRLSDGPHEISLRNRYKFRKRATPNPLKIVCSREI